MKDMTCPYCDEGFDYCDDEPRGEDVVDETQCPECEKYFVFTRSYSIDYNPSKADCLNGSEHAFEAVHRLPRVINGKTKWRCSMCDKSEDRKSTCSHGGDYCYDCKD